MQVINSSTQHDVRAEANVFSLFVCIVQIIAQNIL